jgi:hypothetical protein
VPLVQEAHRGNEPDHVSVAPGLIAPFPQPGPGAGQLHSASTSSTRARPDRSSRPARSPISTATRARAT